MIVTHQWVIWIFYLMCMARLKIDFCVLLHTVGYKFDIIRLGRNDAHDAMNKIWQNRRQARQKQTKHGKLLGKRAKMVLCFLWSDRSHSIRQMAIVIGFKLNAHQLFKSHLAVERVYDSRTEQWIHRARHRAETRQSHKINVFEI